MSKEWNSYGSRDGKVSISPVGEDLWQTNSFFAAKVGDHDPLRRLFDSYKWILLPQGGVSSVNRHNLEVTEGNYSVNGTIMRGPDSTVPNIAGLMPAEVSSDPLERSTVAGQKVLIRVGDNLARLYELDGTHLAVRDDFLSYFEDHAGVVTWHATGSVLRPVVGRTSATEMVALVMPIRLESIR